MTPGVILSSAVLPSLLQGIGKRDQPLPNLRRPPTEYRGLPAAASVLALVIQVQLSRSGICLCGAVTADPHRTTLLRSVHMQRLRS